ncbi:MAG TPA: hypothetical protein GXZ98_00475 [Firmicutes bacterium]|jgi:hypothetical protein|nr:hypothetical protein [Bacillota bacterium]
MLRVKNGDCWELVPIKARIRLDFRGDGTKQSRFFGKAKPEMAAEELRQRQIATLKNLPWQGVTLEDLNADYEVYTVNAPEHGEKVAFAPVELTVTADSLEDLIGFVLREEFRKIKILEPSELTLSQMDMERTIFKLGQEYRNGLNQEGYLH